MGVNNGGKTIYKSIALCWEHVCYLLFEISKRRRNSSKPCIDIDANNTAFKNLSSPLLHIQKLMSIGINEGIELFIVADGNSRLWSKQASIQRSSKREIMRLKAIQLQLKLSSLIQNNPSHPEASELSKVIEKCNKHANTTLPNDFTTQLYLAVTATDNDIVTLRKAEYQADPIIAKRSNEKMSDIIWSNDTDFIVHHPDCIIVNSYKLNTQDNVPSNLILATGTRSQAEYLSDILKNRFPIFSDKNIFKIPSHPLFDLEDDIFCRVFLASAVGNDYWCGGQIDFGVAAAMKVKEKSRDIADSAERSQFVCEQILSHKGHKCKGKGNEMKCKDTT